MEFEGTAVHKEVNAYSEIRRSLKSVTNGIDGKYDKLEILLCFCCVYAQPWVVIGSI